MTTFNSHVLYDASAASNGTWYKLSRHNSEDRSVIISLANTADSIEIQTTTKHLNWDDYDLATVIEADDIGSAGTFTGESSFSEVLQGNFTAVRAVKTGTAGNAKVTING